ncbi:MAG: hypothetical protein ACRECL_20040, partial [Bradyrhizobium sp.]
EVRTHERGFDVFASRSRQYFFPNLRPFAEASEENDAEGCFVFGGLQVPPSKLRLLGLMHTGRGDEDVERQSEFKERQRRCQNGR